MPQNLCFLCCHQLRNTYVFLHKVQDCNLKLIKVIAKQLDCLREQVIDLPELQDEISISSKEENQSNVFGIEDRNTRDSITIEDDSSVEENLIANITLTGNVLNERIEQSERDTKKKSEGDNNK